MNSINQVTTQVLAMNPNTGDHNVVKYAIIVAAIMVVVIAVVLLTGKKK